VRPSFNSQSFDRLVQLTLLKPLAMRAINRGLDGEIAATTGANTGCDVRLKHRVRP